METLKLLDIIENKIELGLNSEENPINLGVFGNSLTLLYALSNEEEDVETLYRIKTLSRRYYNLLRRVNDKKIVKINMSNISEFYRDIDRHCRDYGIS